MASEDNKVKLWEAYSKNRTAALREQIIIEYAPLVKLVAGRLSMYLGYNVEYDDLVGYGVFGLIDAIDKFDYCKGIKFETYASLRIRGSILDQIRKMDWIPRSLRQKQKKIDAAMTKLETELGRPATDEEIAKKINKAIFPGTQGGPLMHTIAAKAVCFGEALKPSFREYAQRVIENSSALAEGLIEEGFRLVSGGTDNHLMLVDLRPMGITGKEFEARLDAVHITVNKNAIPNDPEKPFVTSGVRVGTPAVTSRGLGTEDMKTIARLFGMVAKDFENTADSVRATVADICKKYPLYR